MSARRDVRLTPAEVSAFLESERTAVLTSLGTDGYPHSVAMWFLFDGDRVLMWTYAKSQKARNVERDRRCAFLVESGLAYDELRGILVKGDVELITDLGAVTDIGVGLYARYTEPRTGIPAERGPIEEIRRQAGKRIGIALSLTNVASWDHSKL